MRSDLKDIPQYPTFVNIQPIYKGWSKDKKYRIETSDGQILLLRLSDVSLYDKKKKEYEAIKKFFDLNINMSKPIDFGLCNDGKEVYMLLTWIPGKEAEVMLPLFDEKKQYEMGLEAGMLLKKIHSIKPTTDQPNWEERIRDKVAKKRIEYEKCGYKVPHDGEILQFIKEHLAYLKDCEIVLLHGDFHVGNLIIDENDQLYVIDFNRFDHGDPYEEFNRLMVFSRKISIPFAKGQIKGYFGDKKPPEMFFRRMALYTGINALFSIVWSIPFGKEEIKQDLIRSQMNYEDYKGFTTFVPAWWEDDE